MSESESDTDNASHAQLVVRISTLTKKCDELGIRVASLQQENRVLRCELETLREENRTLRQESVNIQVSHSVAL